MNPESENFEALRRLIKLKRYEQPPPGYYQQLQGSIIARIERGEGRSGFWERFSGIFTLHPALTVAVGMAACGVVVVEVALVNAKPRPVAPVTGLANSWQTVPPTALNSGAPYDPSQPLHVANWLGSTNPNTPMQSLFGPQNHPAEETEFVRPQ